MPGLPTPYAEVKLHNGLPTVFIDGAPSAYHFTWFPAPEPGTADKFKQVVQATARRTGLHLYAFENGTQRFGNEGGSTWVQGPKPGSDALTYDFEGVKWELEQFIEADPEARFHVRLFMEMNPEWAADKWWSRRWPEECLVNREGWQPEESMASPVWRAQVNDSVRKLIAYLQSVGLDKRVLAYQVNVGSTCEWFKYPLNVGTLCGDYSPPMMRYFQGWLRQRYAGDEGALRRAWRDEDVTFDTATVPGPDAQFGTTLYTLRDPEREQRVVDYLRAYADLSAELGVEFCKTVKDACQNRSMAGLFFGYWVGFQMNSDYFRDTIELPAEHTRLQRTGHLGMHRTLLSPHVNFYASPMDYAWRGIGGHCPAMQALASLRAHGKIYIQENDDRCWHPTVRDYGTCPTVEGYLACYRRTLADAIILGQGSWCTSIPLHVQKAEKISGDWVGMFHSIKSTEPPAAESRKFVKEFVACRDVGDFALGVDRTSSAEVCVLLDEESFYYQTYKKNLELPLVHGQINRSLPRMGAPADLAILDDLLDGRLPPYKMYIFLNAYRLDDARREKLKRELRRDGRVAVWVYAGGVLNQTFALEHMTDLTGFQFGMTKTPWGPWMHVTDFDHPITRDVPEDLLWGTDLNISPTFYVQDPEARTLGHVLHAQGRNAEGFCVKEFPAWRSVFCAVPNLPPAVLRGLARYAGVHLYSDASDVLFACKELLAVHTVRGGPRAFALPAAVEVVYDLFKKKVVAEETNRFRVRLPKASTAMFFAGPRHKLPKETR